MSESDLQPSPATSLPAGDRQSTALAASAAIVFLGSAASRLLGLIREQIAAGRFGAGNEIAAFTIADNLNTLLFDLLVNGMLQAAFVPVLALLAVGGMRQSERFRRVSGTLLVAVTMGAVAIAAIGILAAPAFVSLMTALTGDAEIRGSETRSLAIESTRIVMISLPLLGAAAVLTATLYALQRPTGPAIASTMRNGAMIVAMLALSGAIGVRSMAVGVVAGALLMVCLLFASLRKGHALPRLAFDFRDPDVRRVGRLYLPIFGGLLVSSAVVVLDRNLACGAEYEAIGAMRYATTLVQLVLGLVAAAVSIAALPRLARAFAHDEPEAFETELGRAFALVSVLVIPAVLAIAVLARPIVELLFEHGATGPEASRLIVTALLLYLPGHLLAAYDQVLIFAFYARHNTVLPVTVGLVASAAYAVSALLLVERFGMAGLVIANSIQLGVHTAIMAWFGWNRFGSRAFAGSARTIKLTTIASGLMALAGWAVWAGLDQILPDATSSGATLREGTLVLIPLFACGVVYLTAAQLLRIQEIDDLIDLIRSRVESALQVISSR